MSRWIISEVVFYSHDNRNRSLKFFEKGVTIISGDSNTGKSAILSAIDYCLGSSSCEIPIEIKQKTSFVGIKLRNSDMDLFSAREILPNSSSSRTMFFMAGKNVATPNTPSEFRGKTNIDGARAALEKEIGIERIPQEDSKDRVSIRQTTAFTFLSDETIIDKRLLFHGMNKPYEAKHVIGAMPYFLGATGIEDVSAEYRIRELNKLINQEIQKKEHAKSELQNSQIKGVGLFAQAKAVGIPSALGISQDPTSESLIFFLEKCMEWAPETSFVQENDDEDILSLHLNEKEKLSRQLRKIGSLKRSAESYGKAAQSYTSVLNEQMQKSESITIFPRNSEINKCPVCASSLNSAAQAFNILEELSISLKEDIAAINQFSPEISTYISKLNDQQNSIKSTIKNLDEKINALISQQDERKKIYTANQKAAVVLGRISFFLEQMHSAKKYDSSILRNYEEELAEIENKHGRHEKKEKLLIIQALISDYANAFFARLPRNEICQKGKLYFDATQASVSLFLTEHSRMYKMAEIGSDQNYLSIHLAVLFAIQKYLTEANRPVPSFLVIDQISRPYYPKHLYRDKGEIIVKEGSDSKAMTQCFKFIFEEAERNTELQIIILEHAYLPAMDAFREATKYRWNEDTGEKLIPFDWPMYA